MTPLSQRKQQILRALVEEYIHSAIPVASETLVRKYDLSFSSATVRHELAGLEERHRSEKTAMSRLESQWKERAARREEISREIERLGIERSRLLADNIELDRKSAELCEQVLSTDAGVNRLATEETEMRGALAAGEETLKAIRTQVDEARENRSRIEVEGRSRHSDQAPGRGGGAHHRLASGGVRTV